MKYLSVLAIIATALAGQSFSVISIRSGSKFQYAGISSYYGDLYVGGESSNVDFVLNDDGTLYNRATGNYVNVEDNLLVESNYGKSKFKFEDNYLYAYKNQGFYACPAKGNKYALGLSECSGGTPIALRLNDVQDIGDYYPNKKHHKPTSTAPVSSSSAVESSVAESSEPCETTSSSVVESSVAESSEPCETTSSSVVESSVAQSSEPCETTSSTPVASSSESSEPCESTLVSKTSSAEPSSTATPSGSFGLIAINSGSPVQDAPINKVESHLHVFSVGGDEGKPLAFTLLDDGSLVDQDGVGIFVDPSTGEFGNINPNPWGTEIPVTGFTISSGYLAYQNSTKWSACPSAPNRYSLANNNCIGGTSILLKVVN